MTVHLATFLVFAPELSQALCAQLLSFARCLILGILTSSKLHSFLNDAVCCAPGNFQCSGMFSFFIPFCKSLLQYNSILKVFEIHDSLECSMVALSTTPVCSSCLHCLIFRPNKPIFYSVKIPWIGTVLCYHNIICMEIYIFPKCGKIKCLNIVWIHEIHYILLVKSHVFNLFLLDPSRWGLCQLLLWGNLWCPEWAVCVSIGVCGIPPARVWQRQ